MGEPIAQVGDRVEIIAKSDFMEGQTGIITELHEFDNKLEDGWAYFIKFDHPLQGALADMWFYTGEFKPADHVIDEVPA